MKERRHSKKNRVNWGKVGLTAAIGFGVVAILAGTLLSYRFITTTPLLEIKTVKITGNQHISDKAILAKVNLQNIHNIFQIDLGQLGSEIKKIPWVKEVSVARKLPDTLLVDIKEHDQIAIVIADDYFYLGSNGEIFKRVNDKDFFDLPIVTGLSTEDITNRIAYASSVLMQVRDLLDWARKAKFITPANISEIHISTTDGFSLFLLPSGTKVILGKQNLIGELERLEQVMKDYGKQILASKSIDLRFKERVVARLKD